MLFISILLILVGIFGTFAGLNAFGDIGIACLIGGVTALLSGIGFFISRNK